jgi:hypothetical protein
MADRGNRFALPREVLHERHRRRHRPQRVRVGHHTWQHQRANFLWRHTVERFVIAHRAALS